MPTLSTMINIIHVTHLSYIVGLDKSAGGCCLRGGENLLSREMLHRRKELWMYVQGVSCTGSAIEKLMLREALCKWSNQQNID